MVDSKTNIDTPLTKPNRYVQPPHFLNGARKKMAKLALAATLAGGAGHVIHEGITGITAEDPEYTRSYVVKPGDTLWGIAERAYPAEGSDSRDPRELVDEMSKQIEPRDAGELQPGTVLKLPEDSILGAPSSNEAKADSVG